MKSYKVKAVLDDNITTLPIDSCTAMGAIIKGLQLCDAHKTSDVRFAKGNITIAGDDGKIVYESIQDKGERILLPFIVEVDDSPDLPSGNQNDEVFEETTKKED